MEILGKDTYRLINARFTTCQPGQDDWFLEASSSTSTTTADEGKASHPRLRFFDQTMLAFPYAGFPLENRRKSGLLTPYYSQTSTRGLEFGIPYYWNIAPERDATFTPVYMARRGFQLKSHFRYLERPYAGECATSTCRTIRCSARPRTGLSWQHTQNFRPGLVGQVDYNKVSDDRYFVDLASQVKQVSVGNLPQDAYITKTGALGSGSLQRPGAPAALPDAAGSRSRRSCRRTTDCRSSMPPRRTTTSAASSIACCRANSCASRIPTLVEGSRASFAPTPRSPARVTPGWYATPKSGPEVRRLPARPPGRRRAAAAHVLHSLVQLRQRPRVRAQLALVGQSMTQTLEPRLFYVSCPTTTRTRSRFSTPRSPTSTIRSCSPRTASSAATASAMRTS
jgi:LPS-assembly protein